MIHPWQMLKNVQIICCDLLAESKEKHLKIPKLWLGSISLMHVVCRQTWLGILFNTPKIDVYLMECYTFYIFYIFKKAADVE